MVLNNAYFSILLQANAKNSFKEVLICIFKTTLEKIGSSSDFVVQLFAGFSVIVDVHVGGAFCEHFAAFRRAYVEFPSRRHQHRSDLGNRIGAGSCPRFTSFP